eukprot:365742-Chlamydomonas_euryale.AAC.4
MSVGGDVKPPNNGPMDNATSVLFHARPPPPSPPRPRSDADVMNAYFGVPGMVHFSRGQGGLPRVFLKHPYNESAAEIYLHGACVTQWLRPDGGDGLALRPDAVFSGEAAIEWVWGVWTWVWILVVSGRGP